MSFGDFIKSQFLDVIEFVDESQGKLLVSKFERKHVTESGIGLDEIRQGSQLVVRNGQAAVFVSQGKIADVFGPGRYRLETGNLPVLAALEAIPTLLISPLKADLYFVNTTQFLNNKWGTKNPIILRDKEIGMVRVTAFGNYAFRVTDVTLFMNEVFGARKLDMTYDIIQFLDSFIAETAAETIPNMDLPALDLAANIKTVSAALAEKTSEKAQKLGLEVSEVAVESIGLPEEVEQLIDEQSGIGLASRDMEKFMKYQTARAMRDAAKQEGGLAGLGAGMALGGEMASTVGKTVGADEPDEDPVELVRKYKGLLDDGIIDEEEFETLKMRLLGV